MTTEAPAKSDAILAPAIASTVFSSFNRLEEFEGLVLEVIPRLLDEQLVEGIARADALGNMAWRLRGAFAEEVAQRAEKQNGGRGNKDEDASGVTEALRLVARSANVELRTIQTDRAILKTFPETRASKVTRLSREHYRIALSAPDPHKAIELAEQKLDDPGFNTRQFGAMVRGLQLAGGDEGKTAEAEETFWLNVPLKAPARRAQLFLMRHRNLSAADLISQLLIDAADGRENE